MTGNTGDSDTAHLYTCPICAKSFKEKKKVNLHVKLVHSPGQTKFICNFCDKQFSVASNLRRHRKQLHFKQVREMKQCQLCAYKYRDAHQLNIHMRSHTQEKPFRCLVCSRGFSRDQELRLHLRRCTRTGPRNRCNKCQQTFQNRILFNDHFLWDSVCGTLRNRVKPLQDVNDLSLVRIQVDADNDITDVKSVEFLESGDYKVLARRVSCGVCIGCNPQTGCGSCSGCKKNPGDSKETDSDYLPGKITDVDVHFEEVLQDHSGEEESGGVDEGNGVGDELIGGGVSARNGENGGGGGGGGMECERRKCLHPVKYYRNVAKIASERISQGGDEATPAVVGSLLYEATPAVIGSLPFPLDNYPEWDFLLPDHAQGSNPCQSGGEDQKSFIGNGTTTGNNNYTGINSYCGDSNICHNIDLISSATNNSLQLLLEDSKQQLEIPRENDVIVMKEEVLIHEGNQFTALADELGQPANW